MANSAHLKRLSWRK